MSVVRHAVLAVCAVSVVRRAFRFDFLDLVREAASGVRQIVHDLAEGRRLALRHTIAQYLRTVGVRQLELERAIAQRIVPGFRRAQYRAAFRHICVCKLHLNRGRFALDFARHLRRRRHSSINVHTDKLVVQGRQTCRSLFDSIMCANRQAGDAQRLAPMECKDHFGGVKCSIANGNQNRRSSRRSPVRRAQLTRDGTGIGIISIVFIRLIIPQMQREGELLIR